MNYLVLGVLTSIFLLLVPFKFSPKTYIDIKKSMIISNFLGFRLKYTLDNKNIIFINGKKISLIKHKSSNIISKNANKHKKNGLNIASSKLYPIESIDINGVIGIETRPDLAAIVVNTSNLALTAIISEVLGDILACKVNIIPLYNESILEVTIKVKIRTNILRILMLKQR